MPSRLGRGELAGLKWEEMGIPLTQVAPTGCGLPLVFPEVG
jgi:hypothetical protein